MATKSTHPFSGFFLNFFSVANNDEFIPGFSRTDYQDHPNLSKSYYNDSKQIDNNSIDELVTSHFKKHTVAFFADCFYETLCMLKKKYNFFRSKKRRQRVSNSWKQKNSLERCCSHFIVLDLLW